MGLSIGSITLPEWSVILLFCIVWLCLVYKPAWNLVGSLGSQHDNKKMFNIKLPTEGKTDWSRRRSEAYEFGQLGTGLSWFR